MKKIVAMLFLVGMIGAAPALASETPTEAGEEPSKWSKVGEEIGEAAHAVGDATADSSKKAWEATKEGSVEAWDNTKSKSKEMWEKGKAKIHDATAPEAQPLESD